MAASKVSCAHYCYGNDIFVFIGKVNELIWSSCYLATMSVSIMNRKGVWSLQMKWSVTTKEASHCHHVIYTTIRNKTMNNTGPYIR